MADAARVEVEGFRELARGARDLAERIEAEAGEEFQGVAEDAASSARGRVPRVSGRLAGSVVSDEDEGGALVGMGGPGVPYAGWIEFGGTRGRPYAASGRYLYPAAFEAEGELAAAGERAAKTEIRRMRWPSPSL